MIRAVFRGGGGVTAPPDVFDLLQNSETNLQNYWALKLGSDVKSHTIIMCMYDIQLGMCSFQHKWASELQLYLFVLLHHVIMK